MREEYLLTGPLEPTNEAYAVAKIAGIKLCQAYRQQYGANFIMGIPADVFGPGDDFGLEDSHVITALIRKMHEAKEQGQKVVEIWGTGSPRREFIFADDLANACLFSMEHYNDGEPINLGSGNDFSIAELAFMIKDVIGFAGDLVFDNSKPDGMPVKLLDSHKLEKLGWKPGRSFEKCLQETYAWFVKNVDPDELWK
jgi:GDP-L-fucose synthase